MAPFVSPFAKRPLTEWVDQLQRSSSSEDRYRALLAVNALAAPTDVARWCRHSLADADPSLRALAAKQLGELKHRHESDAKLTVAWPDVVADLLLRLSDADFDVRFEAARALGRIDASQESPRTVLETLLDDEATQPLMLAAVVSAIAERSESLSESRVARYRILLSHDLAEVRESVAAAIAAVGAGAREFVAELLVALDDDEPIVRENAARALGHAGVESPEIIAELNKTTADEDEGVAAAAREAIGVLTRTNPRD
jgi:HEAT repeat protein